VDANFKSQCDSSLSNTVTVNNKQLMHRHHMCAVTALRWSVAKKKYCMLLHYLYAMADGLVIYDLLWI